MAAKLTKPRFIAYEVTRRCRYACRHCRAHAGFQENEAELTTSQCKRILNSIAEFDRCTIILTGGEPMERSDIYSLIRYGKGAGLHMVMATCGYLINEKTIAKLKDAGIEALSFSLDGATVAAHDDFRGADGAFDNVMKASAIAKKHHVRFQINMTVSKINVDEVGGVMRLAKKLGAQCFDAFILVPTGRGEQIAGEVLDAVQYEVLLNELLRLKLESNMRLHVTCGPQFSRICQLADSRGLTEKVRGCLGGKEFAFISYRGDVQICGFLGISAGNLVSNHYNFAQIWLGSDFLRDVRDTSKYVGPCADCQYVGVCGGCRARAYAMTGNYLGSDPICVYKQGTKK
jgi:radical SAM protein with 4Fe4S-binding SPASM domain